MPGSTTFPAVLAKRTSPIPAPETQAKAQSEPEPEPRSAAMVMRPLALAVHLAFAASLLSTVGWAPVAHAQQEGSTAAQSQADNARHYDIPAGPLSTVLTQFSTEAGVFLVGATDLVQGKSSPGLSGSYTVEQGFVRLLSGTQFTAVKQANGGYALQQQGALMLPAVEVEGEAMAEGGASNAYRVDHATVGALGKTKLQNMPYSVGVYSRDFLDNQQARFLSDATKYDASISLSGDNHVTENNAFMIRGIEPDFNTGQKLDGMSIRNDAYDLPLEHIENVEILKGAGGFLYGFGAPGGIVNYSLKRPADEFTSSLGAQISDSGLFLLHGDIGGRFGVDDSFGYRINLVGEAGDTYINDGESERKSASIALDWRITENLVWQFDALLSEHERTGGYWQVVANSDGADSNWAAAEPLDPIGGGKRLAPSWNGLESASGIYGTDLLWKLNENWDAKFSYRYSENYRYLFSPAIFADVDGDYSVKLYNYNNLMKSNQAQALLFGEFATGSIVHDVTAGTSRTETTNSSCGVSCAPTSVFLGSGNLSNPTDFPQTVSTDLTKSDASYNEYSKVKRYELFLSDTLHFGDNWDLILGARYGNLIDEYGDYDESAITPTLAAIYRPLTWMSLYASYVEAFEQGNIAPMTAANSGEVFDPIISKQYEIGIKADRESWSANAALFQLQQALTYTDSNDIFSQDGEARYQGLELSTQTRLGNNWLLGASVMWLDATNEKTSNASLEGKDISGVAKEQYRLYGEYDIAHSSWTLTGGAQYMGKRAVDPDNQWHLDAVTLFDLGARYQLNIRDTPVNLRLNVDNLTDEAYWLTNPGNGGRLSQGAPRTLTLGAQIDF